MLKPLQFILPLACFSCALTGAFFGWFYDIGLGEGFIRGLGFGAALVLVLGLLGFLSDLFYQFQPRCSCGKSAGSYTLEKTEDPKEGSEDFSFHFRCACGKAWVRTGKVFYEKAADGSLHPYMRAGLFRWTSV